MLMRLLIGVSFFFLFSLPTWLLLLATAVDAFQPSPVPVVVSAIKNHRPTTNIVVIPRFGLTTIKKSIVHGHTLVADQPVTYPSGNATITMNRSPITSLNPSSKSNLKSLHPSSFTKPAPISRIPQVVNLNLLERSAIVVASALSTWGFVQRAHLTMIQASGLQGVLASLALPTPFAAAALCGSFAAMYTQNTTGMDVFLLGVVTSAVYYAFERGGGVFQKGKGGRLGLVAFLANLIYISSRHLFTLAVIPLGFPAKLCQAVSLLMPCFLCKCTDEPCQCAKSYIHNVS